MRTRERGVGVALLLIATLCSSHVIGAQGPMRKGPGTQLPNAQLLVRQADAAWDDGDRARARELYAAALAADSGASRAVFRLGQLDDSPVRALAFFERYERLEPRDAWGMMAVGDALERLGRHDAALLAYRRAASIAPGEHDVVAGTARVYLAMGRPLDAARAIEEWHRGRADDAALRDVQGRSFLRAGRPRAAVAAFARAKAAGGTPGLEAREAHARSLAAPAVEPVLGLQRDSDGNRTTRQGGIVDLMAGDGVRLGASAERVAISDGIEEWRGPQVSGRLAARARPGLRVDAQGGVTRYASAAATTRAWSAPHVDLRLRARAPGDGASIEVRAQQLALGTAPLLLHNRVYRREARVAVEAPLGFLRVRGSGRAGQVHADAEGANTRTGAEAALMLPAFGRARVLAQYRVLGFARPSVAGYFAPRKAETIEGGAYFETDGESRISLALDLGAGAQRVAAQGQQAGTFTRALRGWGYASIKLGAARALYLEVEAYDSPFSPEGAAVSADWRFASLNLGLRWSLR